MTVEEELRRMYMACVTAMRVWDDESLETLSTRYVRLARETGTLTELPLALLSRAYMLLFAGDLTAAATLIDELVAVKEATGMGEHLAAQRLGRHDTARPAGLQATAYRDDLPALCWALVELVEAATRCGSTDVATDAHARLSEMAEASGTEWALGVQARSDALLSTGDAAERRRGEAREHRRRAHSMLEAMGVAAFADRAGRELGATGETARKRTESGGHEELTAQESRIAHLAREGRSNPEIGTRLFISAHTVQYHLRKVFTKLGITSRSQLDRVLPDR